MVVFDKDENACLQTLELVKVELSKLDLEVPGLEIENSKTEILQPDQPVNFLGLSLYRTPSGFYAKRVPRSALDKALEKIVGQSSFEYFEVKGKSESRNFAEYNIWFESLKRGYLAAYRDASNLSAFEKQLDLAIQNAKSKLLTQAIGADALSKLDDRARRFIGIA